MLEEGSPQFRSKDDLGGRTAPRSGGLGCRNFYGAPETVSR